MKIALTLKIQLGILVSFCILELEELVIGFILNKAPGQIYIDFCVKAFSRWITVRLIFNV